MGCMCHRCFGSISMGIVHVCWYATCVLCPFGRLWKVKKGKGAPAIGYKPVGREGVCVSPLFGRVRGLLYGLVRVLWCCAGCFDGTDSWTIEIGMAQL